MILEEEVDRGGGSGGVVGHGSMHLGFGWVGLVDDAWVQGFDHNVNDDSFKAVGWLWENEHVVLQVTALDTFKVYFIVGATRAGNEARDSSISRGVVLDT